MAVNLNKKTFDEMITKGKGLSMVDFWASWCGPCRQQVPIVDALADELSNKVFIAKVNVEEETILSKMFDIISIPTLIVFKDGKQVERLSGLHTKPQLEEILKKYL